MEKIWRHSLACACSARLISDKTGIGEREKLFMMGLLHDIGKVLLLKTIGAGARKSKAYDREELIESIQEVHTSFGAALLLKWGFEKEFADIAALHEWEKYKPDTGKEILIINLANNLARYTGYTVFDNDEIDLSALESARLLKIEPDSLSMMTKEIKEITGNSMYAF